MQADTYTPADLAERWHVHIITIRRMLERGTLPGFKVGNAWRVTAAVVDAYEANTLPNQI